MHFHLVLFRGLCARVRRKAEAKITVLCVPISQIGPFWRLSVIASTWFKMEFRVVNGRKPRPCWYAVHIRIPNSLFVCSNILQLVFSACVAAVKVAPYYIIV